MRKILFAIVILATVAFSNFCNGTGESFSNKNSVVHAQNQSYISSKEGKVYGRALHILDGDTISFQTNGGQKFKVRLYGIDAPEKAQPYGPQSTGILRKLVGQQVLGLKIYGADRYGRKLAKIYAGKQDLNAEMIKLGAAWHYKQYDKSNDFDRYAQLEKNARKEQKGLWNKPSATPPWEYRKAVRKKID